MAYNIDDIKVIRKKLGLTQGQLARHANVSQSMIAKIEAGILDPAYSKANNIFMALDTLTKKQTPKIKDVMIKKIVSVKPDDTIRKSIQKMKQYEISQIPVADKEAVYGHISEAILLDHLSEGKSSEVLVRDVMKDPPPILSITADYDAATHLLRFYPLVLVSDKGKLVGIVTKSDLIRNMF